MIKGTSALDDEATGSSAIAAGGKAAPHALAAVRID
jgi:hypothetical protein